MRYPCNYGYIQDTISEDGDPIDILVFSEYQLKIKSILRCRPIGMLGMQDECGYDVKILAVPHDSITNEY